MIIVETNLKKIPDNCTKCKYSCVYADFRRCSLTYSTRSLAHKIIPKKFIKDCFNCPMLRDCCIEQDKLLEVNKDTISQICKSLLTKWLYMECNERK